MRRRALVAALLVVAALAALARPGGASAHPLGNFTVNHYAGIELSGDRVFVHYVLDLAEIPTFQSGDRVRAPRLPGRARPGARAEARRRPRAARAAHAPRHAAEGGGGPADASPRSGVRSSGERPEADVRRPNLRRPDRLARGDGPGSGRCTARRRRRCRRESRSDELRAYPRELLALAARRALGHCALRAGHGPGTAPALGARPAPRPCRRRLRGADRARRAVGRRRPRLAARGGVLGRRARADSRPRQGARRRRTSWAPAGARGTRSSSAPRSP